MLTPFLRSLVTSGWRQGAPGGRARQYEGGHESRQRRLRLDPGRARTTGSSAGRRRSAAARDPPLLDIDAEGGGLHQGRHGSTGESNPTMVTTTANGHGELDVYSILRHRLAGRTVSPDRDWPRVELTATRGRSRNDVGRRITSGAAVRGRSRISSAATTPGPWTSKDNRFLSRPPPICGGSRSS